MVRGAAYAMLVAAACAWCAGASVLVPTYVLPPESFARDQRSLGPPPDSVAAGSQRTLRRLVGGHMKIRNDKEYGDPAKNLFAYDKKSDRDRFFGVPVPEQPGGTVGWNQGIWDDGMLMSSAGGGKEAGKTGKDDDEDKKTLSDQVAEGKYGLIQNEIFSKPLKRPGIVSYDSNSETRSKDNANSFGGLKKDEIWLAEDHLLVLKGGSFPERTKETDHRPWPPIDDYEAPRRQVKLPQKPKVPPPFPVRLTDDGPLVFLTPNGSVPAALFPPFYAGEGDGPLPPSPFPFPPGSDYAQGDYQGNLTSGGAPFSIPPFPFLPGNASEGPIFPFPPSMNGSFPEGFPPGAAFLPPPSNQSDLYDEDDPSIYYPPPYNFSYHADNSSVPAGPLVPGIVLPPPPDFFAPLEEKTTTTKEMTTSTKPTAKPALQNRPTMKRPLPTSAYRKPYKPRPTTEPITKITEKPSTITTITPVELITTTKEQEPTRIIHIPQRVPARLQNLPEQIQTRPEKPVYKIRQKVTSKPLSVSVIYDYPEQEYREKIPTSSQRPYLIYKAAEPTPNSITDNVVTSTPVPLRAYYSNTQNEVPTTKLQPVYSQKPKENAVASFYFYDEQPKTTPAPLTYFDGRNYYKAVPVQPYQAPQQNINTEGGFTPSVDVSYGSVDQTDSLFPWPQKQGPRTLTQEYFSIQKPKTQEIYVQPPTRQNAFYQQIADIQQTIDFFTTKRPKHLHRQHGVHKPKSINSRPVYQFAYQSKPRPEPLSFRAPKLDPEPFRPMVSYSKPFNVQNDFNAVTPSIAPVYHQQYLIENVKVTSEAPTLPKYYSKTKETDDNNDDKLNKDNRSVLRKKNKNHITYGDRPVPAVHLHSPSTYPSTTPNPISNGYYTKQDERYFDDITKNSFDVFGKKLEDSTHDINGLAVTQPLDTVKTPIDNNINLQYEYEIVESQSPNPPSLDQDTLVNERLPRPNINPDSEPVPPRIQTHSELVLPQKPPSLAGDTLVNDRLPRPTIDPDSEFVPIPNPGYRAQYNKANQIQRPQYTGEQYDLNQPSLAGDTAVNYRRPLPEVNPNAEWIAPINTAGEGRPGSFVSYRLPGEGAHVYFLTPQATRANRERYDPYRSPGYGR